MPRILQIIDSLGATGAGTQLATLAQGLAENGWDVQAVVLDGARRGFEYQFPVDYLNRRWTLDPLALWRLRGLIRRLRPDVVHTWNLEAAMYGAIAGGQSRLRSMGTGDLLPKFVVGQYRIEPWKAGPMTTFIGRFVRGASMVVTNSASVRAWCERQRWPTEKLAVIVPGVPAAPASDVSRDELLRELELPADARLIGVVSRLTPEKRVRDLIWAADLLRVLHDNLRLLVIGDGPLRQPLEQYARMASDLDHIRFLGERSDVARITPHLDVLWNGSENVGPSMAIFEAMAAGVPVVASDTPANREAVVENVTGYLIPLGSRAGRAARARHTDRILTDAALRNRLGEAAHQRVREHLSVANLTQQYLALYDQAS
jgi:glycosyltransferase involved in cell wall biosynthesis